MAGAIASTGKTDYTTPEYMLRPVRAFFRAIRPFPLPQSVFGDATADANPIDLDPCSNPRAEVFARLNIQIEAMSQEQILLAKYRESQGITFINADGLDYLWWGRRVFINPPFGHGIGRWIRKALYHSKTQSGAELGGEMPAISILLVPETPDTAIWKDSVLMQAMGRCQIGHRPKFKGTNMETGLPVKNGIPKPCSYLYYGPEEFYPLFKEIFSVMGRVECPYRVYAGQGRVWTHSKTDPFPPVANGELKVSPFPNEAEATSMGLVKLEDGVIKPDFVLNVNKVLLQPEGDVQNAQVVT